MFQPITSAFHTVFEIPLQNLLLFLNNVFVTLHIPGAFGFAIIALTILIRLVLHPLFKQQIHTAKKMSDLKPHLDNLSAKHKSDPKKLQQEQLKLYQDAGINPASGCVFLIIQIPIFIALYNTLNLFLTKGGVKETLDQINSVVYHQAFRVTSLNPQFLGINLALTPANSGLWYYYLVPVITGFLQFYQVHVSTPPTPKGAIEKKKKDGEKTSGTEDFQKAMNTQMKFIFPVLIGWFSFSLPVGLSLYWNIFSIFSIIQYRQTHK